MDKTERDCPDCHTRHWGKCLKDRVKEKCERLKEDEEKLCKMEAASSKKDSAAARSARAQPTWDSDSNESNSDYSCVTHVWNANSPAPLPILHCAVAFHHPSERCCMDSGAQVTITPHRDHVLAYEGGDVNVSGIHGDPVRCPKIKMGLQTVTTAGTPLLIEVPGPAILHEGAHSIIVALCPFKRAGYRFNEREGTARDPHDGGYLVTPNLRTHHNAF